MRAVTSTLPKVSIKKGREWPIARGHPWLFSGGISQAPKVDAGALVDLVDVDGKFVARGYYNPNCDIAVRVLTTRESVAIDEMFFERAVSQALTLRGQTIDKSKTNAYRLVNAEGDGLAGFIVDRYDDVLSVQCHTAGADKLVMHLTKALTHIVNPRSIVLRNDASVRQREGLQLEQPKLLHGTMPGDLTVLENGLKFFVDPMHGQKTGYFTDQRDKRELFKNYCKNLPEHSEIANIFSYTGSFGVYARSTSKTLRTINVDESNPALAQAERNYATNNLLDDNQLFLESDAFAFMESQLSKKKLFDATIVDPPAFAKSAKDKDKALKAYLRMNNLAIGITRPGGLLLTCSCSGSISLHEYAEVLKLAAQESQRRVQIINIMTHGADHPVLAVTPESHYLKVIFCRVLD